MRWMRYLPLVAVLLLVVSGTAQTDSPMRGRSPDGLWNHISHTPHAEVARGPRAYHTYSTDEENLRATLAAAPMERTGKKGRIMSIPMPDGSYTRVRVEESPILSPELQGRHQDIRTYIAQGMDDPGFSGRLDHTPAGFHAMLISPKGTVFVNPADTGSGEYVSYWRSDSVSEPFQCLTKEVAEAMPAAAAKASGDKLKTYRLALNFTGEYTQFFGGAAQALAGATTSVNRITGIYEQELSIRLQLVSYNAFTDAATDPYTDGKPNLMRGENQTWMSANLNNNDYDIGHVFGAVGGGGVVNGRTCDDSNKANGATSGNPPQGDGFDVDFAAHEIGHQFGGSHTWSGLNCADAGQFKPNAAMEPGSGTTVMSYAGVCGGTPSENIQMHSDPFFHTVNFDEMTTFRDNSSCGTWSDTGNHAPLIANVTNCAVPRSTPFNLIAGVVDTDEDGDPVTAAFEQFDPAPAQVSGYPSPTATSGPLFRSQVPVAICSGCASMRHLPNLDSAFAGVAAPWEVLPAVDRTLHFRVTARDSRAGGGGVSYRDLTVNVSGDPFQITSPHEGDVLECGESTTITWDVGGVPTPMGLNLYFRKFSDPHWSGYYPIASAAPNDGAFTTPLPHNLTMNNDALIEINASPLCFWNLSKRFSILDTKPPSLTAPAAAQAECTSPSGTAVAIGAASTSDTCDTTPTVSNNAPSLFPLGSTDVLWTATDHSGNSATATQSVSVVDTTPPLLTAPANVVAECTSPSGTPVNVGAATATDICDASLTPTNDAPGVFSLGATTVHWSVADDSGNQSSASQLVTVQDTIAPVISCNAPAAILSSDAAISFTSSAMDVCSGPRPTSITGYSCYTNKNKLVDKSESCLVQVSGATITILNAGGIGNNIDWTVMTVDPSGNEATKTCHLEVVKKK